MQEYRTIVLIVFCGKMAEWFKAPVLKTGEGKTSVSSNLTLSANFSADKMLTDESIQNFTDKLASSSPVPGGGGTAAVVGALAAALVGMMAALTVGKKKYASVEQQVTFLEGELAVARSELLKLVDEDAVAYSGIMACYALPKTTEAEKTVRKERLAKAAQYAALVPLRIAEHCAKVVELAAKVADIGNINLLTDAACGAILGLAAVDCADYNVRINLPLIHNAGFVMDCEVRLRAAQRLATFNKAKVLACAEDMFN